MDNIKCLYMNLDGIATREIEPSDECIRRILGNNTITNEGVVLSMNNCMIIIRRLEIYEHEDMGIIDLRNRFDPEDDRIGTEAIIVHCNAKENGENEYISLTEQEIALYTDLFGSFYNGGKDGYGFKLGQIYLRIMDANEQLVKTITESKYVEQLVTKIKERHPAYSFSHGYRHNLISVINEATDLNIESNYETVTDERGKTFKFEKYDGLLKWIRKETEGLKLFNNENHITFEMAAYSTLIEEVCDVLDVKYCKNVRYIKHTLEDELLNMTRLVEIGRKIYENEPIFMKDPEYMDEDDDNEKKILTNINEVCKTSFCTIEEVMEKLKEIAENSETLKKNPHIQFVDVVWPDEEFNFLRKYYNDLLHKFEPEEKLDYNDHSDYDNYDNEEILNELCYGHDNESLLNIYNEDDNHKIDISKLLDEQSEEENW